MFLSSEDGRFALLLRQATWAVRCMYGWWSGQGEELGDELFGLRLFGKGCCGMRIAWMSGLREAVDGRASRGRHGST